MQTLSIMLSDDGDETTITLNAEFITWNEAHNAFFRMLRGAGYVINGTNYIEAITDDVTELVEAESVHVSVPCDVGGGGFLSGDDNV